MPDQMPLIPDDPNWRDGECEWGHDDIDQCDECGGCSECGTCYCGDDDDGRTLTPTEVKMEFLQALSEGKKVIPAGPICEGFSYETGCPGHETEPTK